MSVYNIIVYQALNRVTIRIFSNVNTCILVFPCCFDPIKVCFDISLLMQMKILFILGTYSLLQWFKQWWAIAYIRNIFFFGGGVQKD